MRHLIIFLSLSCAILTLLFFSASHLFAADSPHNDTWTADSIKKVYCSSCHTVHNAAGSSLTKDLNAALCISCHNSTSPAAPEKPFASSDQAVSGTSGTSHRWDRSMKAGVLPLNLQVSNPNNIYGLRTYEELPASSIKTMHLKFGAVVCSTCHQQHSQAQPPWDPFYGPVSTNPSLYSGTAFGGSTTTIEDTSKTWTADQWVNSLVVINGPDTSPNYDKERRITGNTSNTLTVSESFPQTVSSGETYSITSGRHYQRMADTANEMCAECHYHRTTSAALDVRTWDGNKKSHPIMKNLTTEVSDATQFVGAAPLEPLSVFDVSGDISIQTGIPRYAQNGGTDTNPTNNIVLDANSRVRCLSCHGIHYTDSDSTTVDRSHDDRVP